MMLMAVKASSPPSDGTDQSRSPSSPSSSPPSSVASPYPPSSLASSFPPRSSSARVRPPDWRERRRRSEQRSRQKRKDTIQSMPEQVAAFERAALVVRIIPDADEIWDEFLDEDTKKMRASMRRLLPLIDEVKHLTSSNAQMQRLLREHQLAKRALANITARQRKKEKEMVDTDPWSLDVKRWQEITSRHFRPLTEDQGAALMNAALVENFRFATSKDKLSTGLSFMGWQDSRRIVTSESVLQFNFEKTYKGHDLDDFMGQAWRLYTEESMYLKNVMGGRGRASVNVLQKISPTAWVVRIAEKYHGMAATLHQIFLIFRVDTGNGAIQYVTSIPDTEVQKEINTPSDTWTTNSCWSEWKNLKPLNDRADTDFTFSLGGSLKGDDAETLGSHMCELLGALVRAEGVVNYKPTLVFS